MCRSCRWLVASENPQRLATGCCTVHVPLHLYVRLGSLAYSSRPLARRFLGRTFSFSLAAKRRREVGGLPNAVMSHLQASLRRMAGRTTSRQRTARVWFAGRRPSREIRDVDYSVPEEERYNRRGGSDSIKSVENTYIYSCTGTHMVLNLRQDGCCTAQARLPARIVGS